MRLLSGEFSVLGSPFSYRNPDETGAFASRRETYGMPGRASGPRVCGILIEKRQKSTERTNRNG
jgi:hypothetical protein